MSEFLLYYKRPDPTTWVYLSSFLTIGLFFVFHRFWSVRNLDILLLILLAPGLLMVHEGRRRHLSEMESGEIAAAGPLPSVSRSDPGHVFASASIAAQAPRSSVVADVDRPPPAASAAADTATDAEAPSIQEETNFPLSTTPQALDERLEATTLD